MPDSTPPPGEDGWRPPDVLVVDDNPLNREVFELILRHHGFSVRVACDGQEAVEAARESLPSVVLMDLTMPRMDGYQAAEVLQGINADVPIVAVTAGQAQREELEPLGFCGLLRKPVPGPALVEVVRAALRRERASRWLTSNGRQVRNAGS